MQRITNHILGVSRFCLGLSRLTALLPGPRAGLHAADTATAKPNIVYTAGEDSVSLLPALLGKADKPLREGIVHHSINGSFAIRQGPWKLELCATSGGWSDPRPDSTEANQLPPVQLNNMAKDAGEQSNEYKSHPEIVARLTALLEKYVANGRSTPGEVQKNDATIELWKEEAKRDNATTKRSASITGSPADQ